MGANNQAVIGEGIFDDSREGVVEIINPANNTVVGEVVLAPLANAGFNLARGPFVNTTPGDAPRYISGLRAVEYLPLSFRQLASTAPSA